MTRRLSFLVALAALVVGCGRPFTPATPGGFVVLEDRYGDREYRATTADGVVLGIRAFDNEPKGELAFWTRAVENQMRDLGGYALLDTRDVTSRDGIRGKQLRFGHDVAQRPHLYWLTVYVSEDLVFVLEAGGTKDQVQRFEAQLDWATKSFAGR